MPTLSRELRKLLENTIARNGDKPGARAIAEEGAHKVLADQYAVRHHEPWPHMTPDERELRNQLRAHGRQLGDRRDERRETQEIQHLVQACAYEHWHRMLFARFLAENDLLLDTEHGMAMTLDEVRELGRERSQDWLDIAAELAQRMLLAVFHPGDPVLRVSLPPETRQQLEEKLATLPAEIFRADDSLGWVYQFWQRDEKDRVNKSEVKIGADELPAVTQLFTEDYMVLFLLENTLGSWWTAKRRAEGKDPAVPGYEWTYLRLNEDGSPVAGEFDGWPRMARDLRMLDPSMGSGHFLTFALPILTRMRMEEEGLSLQDAIGSVLRDNLFGLELDARCSQIAAFNLALAAWRLAGEHFSLPELNLACSGLGINASEHEWVNLADGDGRKQDLLRWLYSLFRNGPTLGSLIDPLRVGKRLVEEEIAGLVPLLEEALETEKASDDARELAIAAQGVLAAFRILSRQFTLVATNVPYLGRGNQGPVLYAHSEDQFPDAKTDLATCFVDRCLQSCVTGGTTALVTIRNWLYLTTFRQMRSRLLQEERWNLVSHLGPGAFETISGERVDVSLLIVSRSRPDASSTLSGVDVTKADSPRAKAAALKEQPLALVVQAQLLKHPDAPIVFEVIDSGRLFGRYAQCYQGTSTGDAARLICAFWEIASHCDDRWQFFQCPPENASEIAGKEYVVDWKAVENFEGAAIRGREAWGKRGVAIGQMNTLPATLYHGSLFADSTPVVIPVSEEYLPAIWAFCSSPAFNEALRRVNPKVSVNNGYVSKIEFEFEIWKALGEESYPEGVPLPLSNDPTQWLFGGRPKGSVHPLQVAVARLVGYRWPRQVGSSFPDCPSLEADRLEEHADSDGIVCLSSIAGEASAADRLRALLGDAYADEWSAAKLAELLGECESLEVWLRDRFFEKHCQIFHQRPFVWHIWDGRKDGFHALVNYHKLAASSGEGHRTLEKLIYTSLGDWVTRQRAEVVAGVEGADARLTAALLLKAELEKILAGERPYDIFIRWKPLHEQPIGWEPDSNDGVRLNIRPWLTATLASSTKPRKGSGIFRVMPKIAYGKDRGKEPHRSKEDYPWFWTWDQQTENFEGGKDFDGARWNDLHYSLGAKKDAHRRKQKSEEA